MRESHDPGGAGVRIEGAIMVASRVGKDFVVGRIVSVHGLPQGLAEQMPQPLLRALGVGSQLGIPANSKAYRRVHLMEGGNIQKVEM